MTGRTRETPSVDDYRERIREAGLRSTGARIAVLRALEKTERPVSHSELAAMLDDAGYDQATIYRNLVDLTEAGLLTRTEIGDQVWRFEIRRGKLSHSAAHPHFVCTKCGTVECLPECDVQVNPRKGAPRALRRQGIVIQFQGHCDSCAG